MSKWPFPGDLPVDRARQVAQQYREALKAADPLNCEVIDQAACWAGEGWVVGEIAIEDENDIVTVARAAELVGRSKRWVYAYIAEHGGAYRGGKIMVRVGDVREMVASERAKRAGPKTM